MLGGYRRDFRSDDKILLLLGLIFIKTQERTKSGSAGDVFHLCYGRAWGTHHGSGAPATVQRFLGPQRLQDLFLTLFIADSHWKETWGPFLKAGLAKILR